MSNISLVSTTLLTLTLLISGVANARETCVTGGGLRICVDMKGPCDIFHLVAGEKSKLKLDLFYVSILNTSRRRIQIRPESFYGVSENGQAIVIDAPFYESIELKTKLRRRELAPQESTSGFLFFPSSFGRIRKLVHGVDPFLEIMLY